jgi:hypothetical protein
MTRWLAVRRAFSSELTRLAWLTTVAAVAFTSAACMFKRIPAAARLPLSPALTLAGQFSIPAGQRFPPVMGLPFGGISGLVSNSTRTSGRQLYGISDAQRGGRIYRFSLDGLDGAFRVTTEEAIALENTSADTLADFEALGLLPNGDFLVASEGTAREPRRPPAIAQYGHHGEFLRGLPVRDRYVPEPTGPLTRGARGNAGFESLALAPGGGYFFTAVETALIQDGAPADFDHGARTRLLEYTATRGRFEPAREFVYELEKLERPSDTPPFFINGLVELLVIDRTTLLALERGYVESTNAAAGGMNYIRIYRVSLAGATDVSRLDSIKDRTDVVPVQKTLLLDLSKTAGLDRELAPSLDNFEGMAFGPRLADGRQTLILVSDDNFSTRQQTWFLVFAIGSETVGSSAVR